MFLYFLVVVVLPLTLLTDDRNDQQEDSGDPDDTADEPDDLSTDEKLAQIERWMDMLETPPGPNDTVKDEGSGTADGEALDEADDNKTDDNEGDDGSA